MWKNFLNRCNRENQQVERPAFLYPVWVNVWVKLFSDKTLKKSNPEKPKVYRGFLGAGEQIRTAYLFITNEVLYLLSYTSVPSSDG